MPFTAVVAETGRLTPAMIRLELEVDRPERFADLAHTDSYVKLQLPPPNAGYRAPFDPAEIRNRLPRDQWPRARAITVRAWDGEHRRLTLDVVDHGPGGLAGPWARATRPGELVQLTGPGGGYAPQPGYNLHLLVGDEAALPAIAASLERLPAGADAIALIEVENAEHEVGLDLARRTPGRRVDLRWLHRTDGIGPLVAAVRELELPAGSVQAFVHGEADTVREIRRHLLAERGIRPADLSASGYWRRDRTDEDWRAEKPEWKRQVAADLPGQQT